MCGTSVDLQCGSSMQTNFNAAAAVWSGQLDLVVSAALISMGMMVLPPFFVSLPFKLLLFILVDGWHLVVGSLVKSFHG